MKEFEVNVAYEDADVNPRRDWNFKKSYVSLRDAIKRAKRESKNVQVFEAEVRGYDKDGELIHHSYYCNGILEIDMCV